MASFVSSRRQFFRQAGASAAILGLPKALWPGDGPALALPLADLHVHPSPGLSIARAAELSRERKVEFGMVEHVGPEYAIRTDADLKRYVDSVRQSGMWAGMQPTFPGWRKLFSAELVAQLDYVAMDALELPNPDGSRWLIWRPDTKVDDEDKFMERYLRFNLQIIDTEAIDILAAATVLPAVLTPEYDALWTEERVRALIDAALAHRVALEITQYFQQPQPKLIRLAKAAGLKLTFGTNARTEETVGVMPYCIRMAQECQLTAADIWRPRRG
jgi:hypothetical protein